VPEYWIVIPEQRLVEIYRSPHADGYESCEQLNDPDALLAPLMLPQAGIRLSSVFD
jgi:Uma2 family endonuclease